jgi:hypothetical protein
LRFIDDPSGASFFGRPLWQVCDADIWRWHACRIAARRLYRSWLKDGDE